MADTIKLWKFSENYENFSKITKAFGRLWKLLKDYENFKKILKDSKRYVRNIFYCILFFVNITNGIIKLFSINMVYISLAIS